MRKTNDMIRDYSRFQLKDNYGQGILATIVPGILFWIVNFILGLMVGESTVINLVTSTIISTLTTFMVYTMTLRLAKNYTSAGFEDSLAPSNRLMRVFVYFVVITILGFLIQLPINKLFFNEWIVTQDVINSITQNANPADPFASLIVIWSYLGFTLLVAVALFIIIYKVMFTSLIIIDQGLEITDAVKKSIKYTKGNFFRIVGMRLFFIGWYFLSIFTCGILMFWVIPYDQMSQVNLYLEIKEENGDPSGRYVAKSKEESIGNENDPFEPQKKDPLNAQDPRDNFY